jgi:hypothetical protein
MRFIVFDFEVFRYDTLLGVKIIEKDKPSVYFQTWDLEKIKEFYSQNKESVWIGHNNSHYDNFILQAVINNENVYQVSKLIVENNVKPKLKIKLRYYDLMSWHFGSLKAIEGQMGKNISESEVDFNLYRELTDEEKLKTESYNRDDLDQTELDLKLCKNEIQLRFDMMKEFNLGFETLRLTENQIAEKVLKPIRIPDIENQIIKPQLPNTVRINNEKMINYYVNKEWEYKSKILLNICGVEHTVAKGGIHAARECYHTDWAFYFDVSGYYNLVMIIYNLLPRSLTEEGKKLYIKMYKQQLSLKGIPELANKRQSYKKICLAVFGAELNQYCDFYDPQKGRLVTLTGELFLVDLLEKLEGKIELIQSNTDGIMAKPLEGIKEEDLLNIVKEWCNRTGFVIEPKKIYDIHQRDVNNYMYRDEKGKIHVKGEIVKYYNSWENPFLEDSYNSTTPYIIHHCIVEYYMNNKTPEEIVEQNKRKLRMFQYICKPLTYDYLTFETSSEVIKLQKVNRCFASKKEGMIYKNKSDKKAKYQNLPDSVFIYNQEILSDETIDKLVDKIDYNYYVKRAYERIGEFKKEFEQIYLF